MEYRQLGHSGLTVSAFSLGSWLTYEFMAEAEALAVIGRGIEAGINFFDDARYDDRTGKAPMKTGYSEVVFGRLLRQGGWQRDKLIVANKLWYEFWPDESPEEELNGSLSRLQMEYVDLLYCAPLPESVSVTAVVHQLNTLIQTGKIRCWGVVNWAIDQIEEAYHVATTANLIPPCAAQLPYSLLQRSPTEDEQARQLFTEADIGVVASYSLHGGLLTGKYNGGEGDCRFTPDAINNLRDKGLLQKTEHVIQIAQELGCTPAQLALAYCLYNHQVASLLFGATKTVQIDENLQALSIVPHLNEQIVARLRTLTT